MTVLASTQTSAPSASKPALAEEENVARPALDDAAFSTLVGRLNRLSVDKHFDCYVDVPWDESGYEIDADDPRWIPSVEEAFGGAPWFDELPDTAKSRLGLQMVVDRMRKGMLFENILSRGLLDYAFHLPSGHDEFRYVYHEVVEESQHSMMFQEFVNRSGLDQFKMPWDMKYGSRFVVETARVFPELFFVFVLGGEDPIDHVQRTALRSDKELHPLVERIMRIHVTEEARHLSFARHQLKRGIAGLTRPRRAVLAHAAPLILAEMSKAMLEIPDYIVDEYDIPRSFIDEYSQRPDVIQGRYDALAKVRKLLGECGLLTPSAEKLWKGLKLAA